MSGLGVRTVFMYCHNKIEFCVRSERRPYALPATKSSSPVASPSTIKGAVVGSSPRTDFSVPIRRDGIPRCISRYRYPGLPPSGQTIWFDPQRVNVELHFRGLRVVVTWSAPKSGWKDHRSPQLRLQWATPSPLAFSRRDVRAPCRTRL